MNASPSASLVVATERPVPFRFLNSLAPARLRRSLRLAIKSLWLHRLRSLLTVLGIVFGVCSVIAMLAIGEGRHGGRHGCAVVGEAVLVGEVVGSHGEPVLVGVGWAGSGRAG